MKNFKEFIVEQNYYLEIDNNWDAERNAKSRELAVKALFPKAKEVSWVGTEREYSVYEVKNDGKTHTVQVSER